MSLIASPIYTWFVGLDTNLNNDDFLLDLFHKIVQNGWNYSMAWGLYVVE